MAIAAKFWQYKIGKLMTNLCNVDFHEITSDSEFDYEAFDQLARLLQTITTTEWDQLCAVRAHYQALDVSVGADDNAVLEAYQFKVSQCIPEPRDDSGAQAPELERLVAIQAAYETLCGQIGSCCSLWPFEVDESLRSQFEEHYAASGQHQKTNALWDAKIEGFYLRVHTFPNYQVLVELFQSHLLIQNDLTDLERSVMKLAGSIKRVLESEVLAVTLRKILCIGNHLNAGDRELSRADGFKVVRALQTQIIPGFVKGRDRVSLLQYIRDKELDPEERQAFSSLAKELSDWSTRESSEDGSGDMYYEFTSRSTSIAQKLPTLERKISNALGHRERSTDLPSSTPGSPDQAPGAASEASEMELFTKCGVLFKQYQSQLNRVDIELVELQNQIAKLHQYMAHPLEKGKSGTGAILIVIARLAQHLAEQAGSTNTRRKSSRIRRDSDMRQ